MALLILRCIFVLAAAGLGVSFINSDYLPRDAVWMSWAVLGGMLLLAFGVIVVDVAIRRKQLDVISSVYFGLIVGIFVAYIVGLVLTPLKPALISQRMFDALQLILGLVFCYVCISLLMQTKGDFRFVIPYVEFSRELRGSKPWILDTSAVIDGRIADILEAGLFDGPLVVPNFVITELQNIAGRPDAMRRNRARRGLDILNRLRTNPKLDVQIFERELPEFAGQPVDLRLVALAKHLKGKLVTNDYNLNKVARLQGVEVININDLANALKPVFLPGERVVVRIVTPGKEPGQGVGHLDDGTMVVVEGGGDHIGEEVSIAVTNVVQKSAGRMVFGRCESHR